MNNQEAKRVFLAWKNFHQRGMPPEAVESFNRFLGSWMMFNSIYCEPDQLTGNPASNKERDCVESFEHASAFGVAHAKLLENDYSYAAAVDFIVQRNPQKPQWIHSDPSQPVKVWNLHPSRAQNPVNHGYCQGQHDLKGLLGCLYVARCNLVHGDKEPGYAVDIALCHNAYVILSKLLLNYEIK